MSRRQAQGGPDSVLQCAGSWTKTSPTRTTSLAKVYLKLNSPIPAYSELMRTVDLAPKNLEARISLGDLLLAGRAPDRAAEQANAVLAINPNSADAYALLAGVAQNKRDHARRRTSSTRWSRDPNRAFHSALALLDAGDPREPRAEQELQKAASLDPKDATPHLLLAQLLEKKGDTQGAEQQFQQAISISPKNMEARGALAMLYIRGGDKAKAEQILKQAVQQNPEEAAASNLLASFYGQAGQLDHAVTVFSDLNTKYPKSFAIRLTYARLLFDIKDFDKSSAEVSELTKSDPGNPDVQTLNARLSEYRQGRRRLYLAEEGRRTTQAVSICSYVGQGCIGKGRRPPRRQLCSQAS